MDEKYNKVKDLKNFDEIQDLKFYKLDEDKNGKSDVLDSICFENIEAWKKAYELCINIYIHFKSTKDLNFKEQVTQTALAITTNIAQGYERKTTKELIDFLFKAKGYCTKLWTLIRISISIGYLPNSYGIKYLESIKDVSDTIENLITFKQIKKKGKNSAK